MKSSLKIKSELSENIMNIVAQLEEDTHNDLKTWKSKKIWEIWERLIEPVAEAVDSPLWVRVFNNKWLRKK